MRGPRTKSERRKGAARSPSTMPSRPLPSQSLASSNDGGGPREWEPPDEGGVPQPRDVPLQSDLDVARSLEAGSLDPRGRPEEFVPPEVPPPPRAVPERSPDEEEGGERERGEGEEEERPPPLTAEPPEELPFRREEGEPETTG